MIVKLDWMLLVNCRAGKLSLGQCKLMQMTIELLGFIILVLLPPLDDSEAISSITYSAKASFDYP